MYIEEVAAWIRSLRPTETEYMSEIEKDMSKIEKEEISISEWQLLVYYRKSKRILIHNFQNYCYPDFHKCFTLASISIVTASASINVVIPSVSISATTTLTHKQRFAFHKCCYCSFSFLNFACINQYFSGSIQ